MRAGWAFGAVWLAFGCDGGKDSEAAVCAADGWKSVSAGKNIACGVHDDGCVECWGNTNPDAGWKDTRDTVAPAGNFTKVYTDLGDDGFEPGGFTTCGLTAAHEVRCWGRPLAEIGIPLTTAVDLSIAGEVCGVGLQGGLSCWGAGSESERSAPSGKWLDVDSSSTALVNCALTVHAEIACWGFCDDVMCVPPEGEFVALDLGTDHGCALTSDGAAVCWGGYDAPAESSPEGERFSKISVGSASCGIRTDGTLGCWGVAAGSLLLSPPGGTYTELDVGDGYACAVSVAGDIACWGDAPHGQDEVP